MRALGPPPQMKDQDLNRWLMQVYEVLKRAQIGSVVKFGDIASGNYTEIESDGTIEFLGDATVWDDIRIVPGAFDLPGTSDPALVAYTPGGSGTATKLWEFQVNDIVSFTIQLPHGAKVGSIVYAHAHWTPGPRGNEENGKYVGWKLDYTWAAINGTFGTMATLDLKDACTGTDHAYLMTPDVALAGTVPGISSGIICNFKRTDTGTDDDWVGTSSGELPMLIEIDFHIEMDTFGSRTISSK